nr:hypothetical protein [Tanacetum cinerariifolium]
MMPCPCTTCLNHIEHKVEEVQFHLFKYRIDLSYTKCDKHGEKDEQATTAQIPVNATTEFVDDTDFDMDFFLEIPTDGPATVEMVNATKESLDEDDLTKFQELLLDAKKPLYKGCPDFTKLSTIVKLLNLKGKYRASDKFFTELLGLLKKMLPADSHAWHTVDEKFLEIAKDPRNLRLRILADGVDVNSGTKQHSDTQEMISIFLELLVDDMHTLFEKGVDTYDASTKENFNLRVVVLWTINDYSAFEKNVCESLVETLLNVLGKTKDGINARLDLAELGRKPELFARQEEDKTTLPPTVQVNAAGVKVTTASTKLLLLEEKLKLLRRLQLKIFERNTDPSLPTRVFHRIYVCLGALKLGFRAHRRDLLGLDGAFMKGPFPGQVLVAAGLDSNNGIYPLSYTLAEAETKSSWCWFLHCLGDDIDLHPNSNFTSINDRQKKKGIKHYKGWYWNDLGLKNKWYKTQLYEMHMLLNPSQREELENKLISREELVVLQVEFADMKGRMQELMEEFKKSQ